jgi:hypothetical protein
MTNVLSDAPVTSLRQRMIEDMNMRRFTRKTQFDYVRHVARFATHLGRPPDTATVEELRQFQVEQREAGIGIPTMNSIVSALRFFSPTPLIARLCPASSTRSRTLAHCPLSSAATRLCSYSARPTA